MLAVFWNTKWGYAIEGPLTDCSCPWEFTTDRGRFASANVVIFHLPTLQSIPPPKRPGQAWVAWSLESDINYPYQVNPRFMEQFDFRMTYRLDSDVPCPYLDTKVIEQLRKPPREKTAEAPVACFISSRLNQSHRLQYVRELMKHIPVDSFGRQLQNKLLPEDHGRTTKWDLISRYKFTIAFENSIATDYVTEKFYDPLRAGSIPVYLGAPNVERFAPARGSYINTADFPDPRRLALHLKSIAADPEEMDRYYSWKHAPFSEDFQKLIPLAERSVFCRLCERVQERGSQGANLQPSSTLRRAVFWGPVIVRGWLGAAVGRTRRTLQGKGAVRRKVPS